MVQRLFHEEEGQTLVEYGLLVSLIALVCIAIVGILGGKIRDIFVSTASAVNSTT